ncbi:10549_t:CDS:2, partial [Cetraspora pellucida]
MLRISSKITVGVRNQRFYDTIIGELNEGERLKYRIDVDQLENVTVDVLAGNLRYEKQNVLVSEGQPLYDELPIEQSITIDQREVNPSYNQECSVNIEFIRLASPLKLLCRYLPLNYIKQHVINSINRASEELTKPLVSFNFQHRKPQCVIATASTTTKANEVKRIIKEHTGSSIIKFIRPKIFYDYSCSKGIAEANAFLTFKKWNEEGYNISHFDFRRLLANEMIREIFSKNEILLPNTRFQKRKRESEIMHQ